MIIDAQYGDIIITLYNATPEQETEMKKGGWTLYDSGWFTDNGKRVSVTKWEHEVPYTLLDDWVNACGLQLR